MYVSFLKLWESFGFLGVESGEDGLGGFVGCQGLVTVMEFVVSTPLVWKMRKQCHWPLCIAITTGSLPMIPVGTSILQMTMGGNTQLADQLKRMFGILLLIVVGLQLAAELFEKRRRRGEDNAESAALSKLESGERKQEAPHSSLLCNAELYCADPYPPAPALAAVPAPEVTAVVAEAEAARGEEKASSSAKQPAPDALAAQRSAVAEEEQGCLGWLEEHVGGEWRHWEGILLLSGLVCGALAGILGALFGAGGPAVILLFAYLNGREDLGTSPDALRSTMLISYTFNIVARMGILSAQDLFFFDRWGGYYVGVCVGGLAGALLGTHLYSRFKTGVARFHRILQAMLAFCGLFFIFTT